MEFKTKIPYSKYSTGLSYLPYNNGCAFLSATKDLGAEKIVAFNVSENIGLETGIKSLGEKLSKNAETSPRKVDITLISRLTLYASNVSNYRI